MFLVEIHSSLRAAASAHFRLDHREICRGEGDVLDAASACAPRPISQQCRFSLGRRHVLHVDVEAPLLSPSTAKFVE